MADNEFFEIPGASGDTGGSDSGQGASDDAPADRNALFEQRLERMGEAIQTLVNRDRQASKASEADGLKRKIAAAIGKKQKEVDTAEANLAEAYEDGDGHAIAKAQRTLSELTAQVERMKAEGRAVVEQMQARDDTADTQVDTTNLEKWKDRNSMWFGVDAKMTQDAIAIGKEIEQAGQIETGSIQYYEAIDRAMQRKYPDRLKGSPGSAGQTSSTDGKPRNVTRIPHEVAEGWRRMGIDIDDPEVAKRMLKHRQEAASKGILPPEPQYGRVISR